MFSPFQDEQGAPKGLATVTYTDLAQLSDLDEGYVLEFKQEFSASVRAKVPKIIASFANSRGGWLVIGISDDGSRICPVPRLAADYSQIIGELCRRHISPAPPFDVRFIADPADAEQGVVVVQVEEGTFPPYVADGVVEVREGSTSGPATGSMLVELYDKATRSAARISEFCRRTVFYGVQVPLFDLYFYRMGPRVVEVPSRDVINERADSMVRSFAMQGLDCHVQHAHDSLIFRASIALDDMVPHSSIELFPDESMKLTVPAVVLADVEAADAVRRLRELCGAAGADAEVSGNNVAGARRGGALLGGDSARSSGDAAATDRLSLSVALISAPDTLRRVTRMASILDRYVRERGTAWQRYATAYELENMAGVLLWSDDPVYLHYVQNHGPLFCGTTDCRSRVRYLDDGEHNSFRARQFAGSHFFEACGLPLGSPSVEDNELVDVLLRTERGARK
ncbi:ATP-binding protein [uncultured Enorma sp.]|uniref:ATP-binding protein n=1 Tax=uncultured Enorma sp. TaxID=1714346 RepID=UPI002805A620|nr:ATP-binding protein [uncultured Enorma sp.]